MSVYSRQNPSQRYRELVALYQQVHREGIPKQKIPAEKLYAGRSLIAHLPAIKSLVVATGARSLLDYGSGKGTMYRQRDIRLPDGQVVPSIQEYLGVARIACYDPAVPEHASFPSDQFDSVISTDALEHCPEQDMPWIVEEMFAAAKKFVFANVASCPAHKRLPNGENAHATQQPVEWWADLIRRCAANHCGIIYEFKIVDDERRGLRRLWGSSRRRLTVLSNAGQDGTVLQPHHEAESA